MFGLGFRKTFEITYVQITGDNSAKIGGRAYEKIHVGDILVVKTDEDISAPFKVLQILVYDRSLEEVDELFTPWLFLEGSNANLLLIQTYLYSQFMNHE
jgi:hypothetical protein